MVDTPCQFARRAFTAASNRIRVARWIGEQAVTLARRELVSAFHAGAVRSPSATGRSDAVEPSGVVEPSTNGLFESSADVAGVATVAGGLAPSDDSSVVAALLEDMAVDASTPPGGIADTSTAAPATDRLATGARIGAEPDDAADGLGSGLPPFEGYDTLPAAHIVQRLGRLAAEDLAIVRAYELDHRARRTVVAKVDQLLDA
jgi:hypothetical protein